MARLVSVIWAGGETIYFFRTDWTGSITLKWLNESSRMRMGVDARGALSRDPTLCSSG
jgi:hypothetical protein